MSSTIAFSGSVPANYEKYLGPALFEPYALDIINRVKNKRFSTVLELACGTGRVTRHLLKLIPENGQLVASDINPDMVEIGKTVVTYDSVLWLVADAQQLPFKEESFDLVVCQFGIMFCPDKEKAVEEAYRVLTPKGSFVFNVWDDMIYNPSSALIKKVVDEIMGDQSPDFLKKGPYSFYNKEEIKRLLQEAGFNSIKLEVVPKIGHYDSANDIIKGFVDGSPLASYLTELDAERSKKIRDQLFVELSAAFGEENLSVPMQAIVVEASK